jgi:hypothetical protein
MGICADIPCCCNDCIWFSSSINETYAAKYPECYMQGSIDAQFNNTTPASGNGTRSDGTLQTAGTGMGANVFNGTRSDGTVQKTGAQLTIEKTDQINELQAEKKRLFIDIPLMLSKVSGVPSMLSTFAVLTIFTLILIKQPVM